MENKQDHRIELFVPGRLCLFGEHSDWAGQYRTMNAGIVSGHSIVTGLEQGIYATAEKYDKFRITSALPEYSGESFECSMNKDILRETAKEGGFFSYVAGVASYISEWYRVGGVSIDITKMTLPMKSGLSSSAAICVLVARAFNILYDLRLNTLGVMNIAYLGEQRTPSRCGRLDQACAFGVTPVSMIFDGNEIMVDRIRIGKPLHYVFADLMSEKDTVAILRNLNKGYPFASNETEEAEHSALGPENEEIISRAVKYMEEGDTEALGALMTEAQELFDKKIAPMSPKELESPILHKTLNDETIKTFTYGGKGVGSQGDGTVQFLAKDHIAQQKLKDYLQGTLGMTSYSLTLNPEASIRKAVIPVAGYGTRLYPETRTVKKEFCPVIDRDGLVKPAILVLLEELDSIEIEEICLIINAEERKVYDDFFEKPLSEEHYRHLPDNMKKYEDRISRIAKKLKYIVQDEQKGFGHAVSLSRDFAGSDPVLLLLGDTIYRSFSNVPCTAQLINAYEKHRQPMVAVHPVPLDDVVHYGIFAGEWENEDETVMKLDRIAEKPEKTFAMDYLKVGSVKRDTDYYAAFGAYILTLKVYDRLDEMIRDNVTNEKGEIELTTALSDVREDSGMMAFVPDGESYDIGNAEAYRRTLTEFGRE